MSFWPGRLLVLSLTSALCCDWLSHYGQLSNKSLTLIDRMGGELTEEENPLSFPNRFYRRIRNKGVVSQLVFIRDSLKLIANLFEHANLSAANWDNDTTENFLTIIDRQIDELDSCVSTNRTANSQLEKYYKRLERSTVQRRGGSAASWELLRKDTKRHLVLLDMLVNSIRAPAAVGRRRSAAH
ncbi:interferon a3-like [Cottoperca gobio]|uniref:Interferon a3-like n=1 Tax=Cottoperca gobio TaxID=56716 RepID=A0A6J2P924_COTGO|nr:interferon a3-like [Cottoperca gobio]